MRSQKKDCADASVIVLFDCDVAHITEAFPHERWNIVNAVLGYSPTSPERVTADFWDAIIDSTPCTRADGSVVRTVLFPRAARGLHRLNPSLAPDRLYAGRITLTLSNNLRVPTRAPDQHLSSSVLRGFRRGGSGEGETHARLVLEDLRALPLHACGGAPAPAFAWPQPHRLLERMLTRLRALLDDPQPASALLFH